MRLELPIAEDYKPNEGELDNILYLTFKYTVGWPMRQADKMVCLTMAGEAIGDKGISKLVETACEYIWDHICSETDEFTPEQLFEHMKTALTVWYTDSTPEERSNTETAPEDES